MQRQITMNVVRRWIQIPWQLVIYTLDNICSPLLTVASKMEFIQSLLLPLSESLKLLRLSYYDFLYEWLDWGCIGTSIKSGPWYSTYCLLLGILCSLAFSQVCDCQHQFARWEDGQQRALPIFSSCQGPEFTRFLLEIEGNFHRGLQKLRSFDKGILDIENTTWRNEFNT